MAGAASCGELENCLLIADVAAQLSPREFALLCGIVDGLYGKKVTEVANAQTMTPKTASRVLAVKFDVYDIVRTSKELNVTVRTEKSEGLVRVTVK